MAFNITDLLNSQLDGQATSQLSQQLGESEHATRAGISAAIPTILAGALKQVSAPGGAERLDQTLAQSGYDGGLWDDLPGSLSRTGADSLSQRGGGLISMLLGDKAPALAARIADSSGMKTTSVTSLLTILAPLVLSFLGKQKTAMGLDSGGLANLLIAQQESILASLPPGASESLGLAGAGSREPVARTASHASTESGGGGGFLKILIPLIVLAAVGYGCYWYIFDGIRPSGAAGNVLIDSSGMETIPDDVRTGPAAPPPAESPDSETPPAAETAEPKTPKPETPEPEDANGETAE